MSLCFILQLLGQSSLYRLFSSHFCFYLHTPLHPLSHTHLYTHSYKGHTSLHSTPGWIGCFIFICVLGGRCGLFLMCVMSVEGAKTACDVQPTNTTLHPNSHVSTFVYGPENSTSKAIQYTHFTNNTFLEMSNNITINKTPSHNKHKCTRLQRHLHLHNWMH